MEGLLFIKFNVDKKMVGKNIFLIKKYFIKFSHKENFFLLLKGSF